VVVRGAGERAFVAGADISELLEMRSAEEIAEALVLRRVLDRIAACPKPVIAAIHGFCLGGGLELAIVCDLRIATEDALLGLPEVRLGLIPGAGGTQRLPRLIGFGRALLMTMTGDPISGAEAYAWGLVERVVAGREELDEAVASLAGRLARQSPSALAGLKRLRLETAETTVAAGNALEARVFAECLFAPDGQEGVAAFLEKRPPVWPG
jgi:enoyl-CoA hydratase